MVRIELLSSPNSLSHSGDSALIALACQLISQPADHSTVVNGVVWIARDFDRAVSHSLSRHRKDQSGYSSAGRVAPAAAQTTMSIPPADGFTVHIRDSYWSDLGSVAKLATLLHELAHVRVILDRKSPQWPSPATRSFDESIDVMSEIAWEEAAADRLADTARWLARSAVL